MSLLITKNGQFLSVNIAACCFGRLKLVVVTTCCRFYYRSFVLGFGRCAVHRHFCDDNQLFCRYSRHSTLHVRAVDQKIFCHHFKRDKEN